MTSRAQDGSPWAWVSSNKTFSALFVGGVAIRVLVMVAYRPSLPMTKDAFSYVQRSVDMSPQGSFHPFMYPLLLKPFLIIGHLAWAISFQHLGALAIAAFLYQLLRRQGVPAPIAALGQTPLLFDAFQLEMEHQFLAEAFFELFLVLGLYFLLSMGTAPNTPLIALGGVLIGISSIIRFVGLGVLVAGLIYVGLRRLGWLRAGALLAGFLVPIAGYSLWFKTESGSVAITNRNGFFLYGRVADFADCDRVSVDASLRVFCPKRHPSKEGLFTSGLPDRIRTNPKYNSRAMEFSRTMIVAMPYKFFEAVASDFALYFVPGGPDSYGRAGSKWRFPPRVAPHHPVPPGSGIHRYSSQKDLVRFFHGYSGVVWTAGPVLGALVFLGLLGGLIGWARWGRRLGPEALLFTLTILGILLFAPVFAVYHFRYVIPVFSIAGTAGALGVSALLISPQQEKGLRTRIRTGGPPTVAESSETLVKNR